MAFDHLRYDREHYKRLDGYAKRINALITRATRQALALQHGTAKRSPDAPFSFADFPQLAQRYKDIVADMAASIEITIRNGISREWGEANTKGDDMVNDTFGSGSVKEPQFARYAARNTEGMAAFANRRVNGLGLSERVWNLSTKAATEIELAIDAGLSDGRSAAQMSRDVRKYLNNPDKLFRRVRNQYGELGLSKAAKAYHPGRGVYRSSYKNAMRLTRTEINMAYRTADYLRWQQFDFVVGFEVRLSNNHPVPDICDDLKGKYPKDFKFTGWHPQCRCHAISILATRDELELLEDQIWSDTPAEPIKSVNQVDDIPQGFKDWIKDNDERSKRWKSQPYFMKDNPQYVESVLRKFTPF